MDNNITYKELLQELSIKEEFDYTYSIKHLTVDECFRSDNAYNKEWNDIADIESKKELTI